MSFGSSSAGEFDRRDIEREPVSDEAADEQAPSVLERVIEQTLSMDSLSGALEPEELAALLEVARRHRHRPLELEPVVVDLVEAILKLRFQRRGTAQQSFHEMSRQLAESLFHTPQSHRRLSGFWSGLVEATS